MILQQAVCEIVSSKSHFFGFAVRSLRPSANGKHVLRRKRCIFNYVGLRLSRLLVSYRIHSLSRLLFLYIGHAYHSVRCDHDAMIKRQINTRYTNRQYKIP